jgi:hypothetical protein
MKNLNSINVWVLGIAVAFSAGTAFASGGNQGPGHGGKKGKKSLVKYKGKLLQDLNIVQNTAKRVKRIAKNRLSHRGNAIAIKANKVINRSNVAKNFVKNIHLGGKHAAKNKKKRLQKISQKLTGVVRELRGAVRAQKAGKKAPRIRNVLQRMTAALQSFQGTVKKATKKKQKLVCMAKDTREFNNPSAYKAVGFDRASVKQMALGKCLMQSHAYRPNCVIKKCKVL